MIVSHQWLPLSWSSLLLTLTRLISGSVAILRWQLITSDRSLSCLSSHDLLASFFFCVFLPLFPGGLACCTSRRYISPAMIVAGRVFPYEKSKMKTKRRGI